MLISPPFLPERNVAGTPAASAWMFWDDEPAGAAWFEKAMACAPGAGGGYLVGRNLAWHGGVHLRAPKTTLGTPEPVRAIALGRVAYVRAPRQATTSSGSDDPQAAYGGWTDNGCIVLRHETEIGEGPDAEVEFYSIYMHLSAVEASVTVNAVVQRKSQLGQPGRIYGTGSFIQLDIVCNDAHVTRLMGSALRDPMLTDGRSDALYGDTHYVLPAGTPAYARLPQLDYDRAPNGIVELPTLRIDEDLILSIRLAHGDCRKRLRRRVPGARAFETVATSQVRGTIETRYEYTLHTRAMSACVLLRERGKSDAMLRSRFAPVAHYELMRFGRVLTNIGDKQHASLSHVQPINLPSGTVWVDLSQSAVRVSSDADFPPWTGWRRVSDCPDGASRCGSPTILSWLGKAGEVDPTRGDIESALSDPNAQRMLDRTVCRFPTEWDGGPGLEARWSWLMHKAPGNPEPMSEADFGAFCRHAKVLTFWEHANLPLSASHWHFHPREFIGHFRRCGWLSRTETTMLIPRTSKAAGTVSWASARSRLNGSARADRVALPNLDVAISRACRRYGLTSPLRKSHFFAQILQETGAMVGFREIGNPDYFRKLYEVITAQEAGADHDAAVTRKKPLPNGCAPLPRLPGQWPNLKCGFTREDYMAKRPSSVRRKAIELGNVVPGDGGRFHGRGLIQLTGRQHYIDYGRWRGQDFTQGEEFARLENEPELIADSAGRYWVSRKIARGIGIVEMSHRGTHGVIELLTTAVNGGSTHLENRKEYFDYVWSQLNDCPPSDTEGRPAKGVELQRPEG